MVLNNLYAQTGLQSVFGINMVALVDGQPRRFSTSSEILEAFIRHRREVVTRRTVYLLRKARERGHLLEGLAIALSNIDPVIALIKASPSSAEAREKLLAAAWEPGEVTGMLERAGPRCLPPGRTRGALRAARWRLNYLSPAQAQAILDLRLHRLTGLGARKNC